MKKLIATVVLFGSSLAMIHPATALAHDDDDWSRYGGRDSRYARDSRHEEQERRERMRARREQERRADWDRQRRWRTDDRNDGERYRQPDYGRR